MTSIIAALGFVSAVGPGCGRKSTDATPTLGSSTLTDHAPDAGASTTIAASANASPRSAGRWVYEGTIADRPVLVRIHCDGATCSGKYFYEAIGETLRLTESAPNHFDEHVGVGAKAHVTGRLAFDGPSGGEQWNGTFVVDGKDASATNVVRLARVEPSIANAGDRNDAGKIGISRYLKRTFHETSPKDRDCNVSVVSFEIVGLADADLEDRINAAFDPAALARDFVLPPEAPAGDTCGDKGAQCDVTASGYRILCRDMYGRSGLFSNETVTPTFLDEHLLSARSDYGFDGGGAHPSDGVAGVTLDLTNGHVLDARDFLKKPNAEPAWAQFATPPPAQVPADLFPDGVLPLDLGIAPGDRSKPIGAAPQWLDFFLTRSGFEMVPNVPEVARALRGDVQHVPFAKVRSLLLPNGPAAYLYAH